MRESYIETKVPHKKQRCKMGPYNTHLKQTTPSGQGQCDMLSNPIITDFVKTSHLFHVIIMIFRRQKAYILPESKKKCYHKSIPT